MDPNNLTKEYSNGEVTIVWQSGKCIHSANCVKNNPDVFAYTRELNEKKFLVMLNFRNKPAAVNSVIDVRKAKLLISNYTSASVNGTLQPYEAVIYAL